MVELTTQNLHSHKFNDRKSIVQNFKTVIQSQVELYSCKVEKSDASIKPLFAIPVTNTDFCCGDNFTEWFVCAVVMLRD